MCQQDLSPPSGGEIGCKEQGLGGAAIVSGSRKIICSFLVQGAWHTVKYKFPCVRDMAQSKI